MLHTDSPVSIFPPPPPLRYSPTWTRDAADNFTQCLFSYPDFHLSLLSFPPSLGPLFVLFLLLLSLVPFSLSCHFRLTLYLAPKDTIKATAGVRRTLREEESLSLRQSGIFHKKNLPSSFSPPFFTPYYIRRLNITLQFLLAIFHLSSFPKQLKELEVPSVTGAEKLLHFPLFFYKNSIARAFRRGEGGSFLRPRNQPELAGLGSTTAPGLEPEGKKEFLGGGGGEGGISREGRGEERVFIYRKGFPLYIILLPKNLLHSHGKCFVMIFQTKENTWSTILHDAN